MVVVAERVAVDLGQAHTVEDCRRLIGIAEACQACTAGVAVELVVVEVLRKVELAQVRIEVAHLVAGVVAAARPDQQAFAVEARAPLGAVG